MSLEFTKGTDRKHEIQLDSRIVSAEWRVSVAYGGQSVPFVVVTELVGYGAPIEVIGRSENGKDLGSVRGVMRKRTFRGTLHVPEDIELGDRVYFQARLPDHGLEHESERIPARPPIEVSDLKWSAQEARRGDVLTLTASVRGVPSGTEATITIYEFDRDRTHDRITELPCEVLDGRIEIKWLYDFHEDTDEIPSQGELERYGRDYNPPEYFFTATVEGCVFGRQQESGLLVFKDWIEITLIDEMGKPVPGEEYTLHLPDGTERRGTLDENGHARVDGVPPGPTFVEFPNAPGVSGTADGPAG